MAEALLTPSTPGEAARSSLVRPGARPDDIVALEGLVVSFFVDAAEILGVPKSVAAIYGICFASHEPLSFSEINERLDLSAGSISQGLRVLKEVGALKTALSSPDRRDRFAPDLELRKLAAHFIEQRLERQLRAGSGRLQAIKARMTEGVPGKRELRVRIKALETWHRKSRALLPIIKAFLKLS